MITSFKKCEKKRGRPFGPAPKGLIEKLIFIGIIRHHCDRVKIEGISMSI
jgi:hypothetical protein